MPPERWKITLLGGLSARRGTSVFTACRTRKTASLLAYLACSPQRPYAREELMDLLWNGEKNGNPDGSLRGALSALRHQLEPEGVPRGSVLETQGHMVRLNPDSYECDVRAFEQALHQAEQTTESMVAPALLDEAIDLYRGPLMPGFSDDWMRTERERLRQLYVKGVRRRLALMTISGQTEEAIGLALTAIRHEPLNEGLQGDLLHLYALTGRQEAIHHAYEAFCSLLRTELTTEPSSGMQKLFQETLTTAHSASTHLKAAPTSRSNVVQGNLPASMTPFFGRETELSSIAALLSAPLPRLITLIGIGGIGKTRLALEAARHYAAEHKSLCLFVRLNEVLQAQQLPFTLRNTLRLDPQSRVSPLEQVMSALTLQPTLLLLDNFDTLLQDPAEESASVAMISALLEHVPDLKILITSRQPLVLPAEQEFPVPPLPVPEVSPSFEDAQASPSVRLFLDRACAVRPRFHIAATSLDPLIALCRKLDGLPLAIELAAGWAGSLTPSQMLARMEHRFEFLRGGSAGVEPRHRVLTAVFDTGYDLLPPELQRLFACLSVFRGGWTLEAAEAICGNVSPGAVLDGIEFLRQRSLVSAGEEGDAMRYRFLETLREYAAEHLAKEDRTVVHDRHAAYFTRMAEAAEEEMKGRGQKEALNRLEADHDNIRASLDYTLQSGQTQEHFRQVSAIGRFWARRGYLREGSDRLALACALQAENTPARVRVLIRQGVLFEYQGETEMALQSYRTALRIAHAINDMQGCAVGFHGLGILHLAKCFYAKAERTLRIALSFSQKSGNRYDIANIVHSQASVALAQGDYLSARELYLRSFAMRQEIGDLHGMALACHCIGAAQIELGDLVAGRRFFGQAIDYYRDLGHQVFEAISQGALGGILILEGAGAYGEARTLLETSVMTLHRMHAQLHEGITRTYLGDLCILENRLTEAEAQLQSCLQLLFHVQHRSRIADAVDCFACLALAHARSEQAARWFAAADALRTSIKSPVHEYHRQRRARHLPALQDTLGKAAFDAAQAGGGALSLEEICQEIGKGEFLP